MRTEENSLHGYWRSVSIPKVPAYHLFQTAAGFYARSVKQDPAFSDDSGHQVVIDPMIPVEQLDFISGYFFGGVKQGFHIYISGRHDRMMVARIFHIPHNLQNQAALGDFLKKLWERRMIQVKGLIAGINPYPSHPIVLVATAEVFHPIRPSKIDRTEGSKESFSYFFTLLGKPLIDTINVFVEQCLETTGPGFLDLMGLEFCH